MYKTTKTHEVNIKTAERSFEIVKNFKQLRKTQTHQTFLREEIKIILNSRNAYYQSVQNRLPVGI